MQSSYSINNTTLKLLPSGKYFGVIVDSKLNFNEHICKKAVYAKRQTPLVHLSIETREVVQWKSKHLHTRPSYDPSWSMLRQFGPLTLTVTLTALKQFSAELPDLQWKTGVDQLTSSRQQQLYNTDHRQGKSVICVTVLRLGVGTPWKNADFAPEPPCCTK